MLIEEKLKTLKYLNATKSSVFPVIIAFPNFCSTLFSSILSSELFGAVLCLEHPIRDSNIKKKCAFHKFLIILIFKGKIYPPP